MLLVHRVPPRSSPGWIVGAQNEVGESLLGLCLGLSTVVLELSSKHSFSYLSSEIPQRDPGDMCSTGTYFGGSGSSGS